MNGDVPCVVHRIVKKIQNSDMAEKSFAVVYEYTMSINRGRR